MIIIIKDNASKREIENIINLLDKHSLKAELSVCNGHSFIKASGDIHSLDNVNVDILPGVCRCVKLTKRDRAIGKKGLTDKKTVKVGNAVIGADKLAMIAGPCSIESKEQIYQIAKAIKKTGAIFLRGGAYKPRTSPYAFQGLKEDGLKLLKAVADELEMYTVSEVVSEQNVDVAYKYCDVLQIGARNMQNYGLLKTAGQSKKAILLKRGICATIEEWLDAAEYIVHEGNENVILCERGIRTFETATRNTLDISAIAVIKDKCSLPIIVDPSHAAGDKKYVESLCLAAIAAGADGLMVEVHNNPGNALSDAKQQILPEEYDKIFKKIEKLAEVMGRTV